MNVHNLDSIFRPKRIALFGVSENPRSVGRTILRNIIENGFNGVVYPVDLRHEAVQGIQCYPSLRELPRKPDMAVVCSPAQEVPGIVHQCGEAGVLGVVIISAGFGESGTEGKELEESLAEEIQRFPGMRLLGPNCLGVIVPGSGLNASFATGMPRAGKVAFISQSGALCTSVLDWAMEKKIGFSYFVSIGNTLDIDFADLIDYFGENDDTDAIVLYVESIKHAHEFMAAARAFSCRKPIVAYKAGRFPESAGAVSSHTGAMAGEDAVYGEALRRAGIVRVFDIGEIFDCASLLARHHQPRGKRLGIVTNAGGPGVMATDALIARNGALATLSEETVTVLNECLPPMWSGGNPVDVLGDAQPRRFAKAVEIVLRDSEVDAVLAILSPQAMTRPTATAKELCKLASDSKKPILATWLGGKVMREGIQLLDRAGIAAYRTPEQAVRAFMSLVDYTRTLELLHETPREVPLNLPRPGTMRRELAASLLAQGSETLTENDSKAVLSAYGIPVAVPEVAANASQAVDVAWKIGYPVVLKVLSPDITHKTDVGGIALDLRDQYDIRSAYERIVTSVKQARPDARISGVTVQPMVRADDSVEMILGAKKDPTFGAVIMVGMGGITAEVLADRALGLPPLNERLARRMIQSLKSYPILRGYRGRRGVDLDNLVEIVMRFSYLVADHPEIRELDVNPLLAGPGGIIALDARIVVEGHPPGKAIKPYEHLIIRPYPEEFTKIVKRADGTTLTLRPIRPEDETRWMTLLESCSPRSIHDRFGYLFHFRSHEAAVRYCFTDYDREMAIVAEKEDMGQKTLLAVGRMVADPDHDSAEYAVLVGDQWQNNGIGGIVLDHCIDVARRWGINNIEARTLETNSRMLSIFRSRGFHLDQDAGDDEVRALLPLAG